MILDMTTHDTILSLFTHPVPGLFIGCSSGRAKVKTTVGVRARVRICVRAGPRHVVHCWLSLSYSYWACGTARVTPRVTPRVTIRAIHTLLLSRVAMKHHVDQDYS